MARNPNICRVVHFRPYRKGMGPTFTLTLTDNHGYGRYGKNIVGYRLTMKQPGQPAEVLFAGTDFETPNATDSDECVDGIMGFLTLKPGDTDPDYFAAYTPAQLAYCEEHAETLSYENESRFGEGR